MEILEGDYELRDMSTNKLIGKNLNYHNLNTYLKCNVRLVKLNNTDTFIIYIDL